MKEMHLICNAHIDPLWQWDFEEGIGCAISTFRVAAKMCKEFDCFIFNHNEALLYKYVEKYEPVLFKEIQNLVKKKKWNIMGGWYLQPDCNMPNGESFVRQILLGQKYFKEKFEINIKTAINFDSFGHTKGLVQILEKSGYENYIICRPTFTESLNKEQKFIWKGFANSKIKVLHLPFYNTPLGNADKKIHEALSNQKDNEIGVLLWGVGNHGGGPSRIDLEKIEKLRAENKIDIIHSDAEKYFNADKDGFKKEYDKSLLHCMTGCYTSQVQIKQKHHLLENEIIIAEKMCSHAANLKLMKYPQKEINDAWEQLMFAQFHDILPGSSIQKVEDAGLRVINKGLEEIKLIKTEAFYKLSIGQNEAKNGELPILVYNVHPFDYLAKVECEFMLQDQNFDKIFVNCKVFDEDNKELVCQIEKELSNIPIEWRKKVVFETILKASSMNRFNVSFEIIDKNVNKDYFENDEILIIEHLKGNININKRTGLIDEYNIDGENYINKDTCKLNIIKSNEDPWGMGILKYNEIIGSFILCNKTRTAEILSLKAKELSPVRVIEEGKLRTVVESAFEYNHSVAIVRYTVYRNSTEIGIFIRLINNEKDKMIKLSIPTQLASSKYFGKTAFGINELDENYIEVVAQEYVFVKDKQRAVSLINQGCYGSSFNKGEIDMTLIKSAAYCGHPIDDRNILPQDRFTERIEQGERIFEFVLNASEVNERLNKIERESLVFNQKPYAISFFPAKYGVKPKKFLIIDNENIILSTVKKAENNENYIIRLFNSSFENQKGRIKSEVLGIDMFIDLISFEVKTYLVKKNKNIAVNLTENKI